ncbi:MAG: OsmC family protein [Bryobacterales bacterium]|nr:OsmC family protein [Bryobacterales bacterium]
MSATTGPVEEVTITLEQLDDYEFKVRFDKPQYPEWLLDEPAPLGRDAGPNATRALAAAVGNCLSASLLFCARKAKVEIGPIRTQVRTQIARGERSRLRIVKVAVQIDPAIAEADRSRALRCLELFEDYCVVTQSVRDGIEVEVSVVGFPRTRAGEPA